MKEVNSVRKKHKLTMNGKTYTFNLNFKALIKLETEYRTNARLIIQNALIGANQTENILKILSCSCDNSDLTYDYLAENIKFSIKNMNTIKEIARDLIGINDEQQDDEANNDDEVEP